MTCTSNVERLKAGPDDIGSVIAAHKPYTDQSFEGPSMVQIGGEGTK